MTPEPKSSPDPDPKSSPDPDPKEVKVIKVGEWCWSGDGEYYGDTFAEESDAIAAATACGHEGDTVCLAQVGLVASVVDAVLGAVDMDYMREAAEDSISGEFMNDAPVLGDVSAADWDALEARMKKVIRDWGEHDVKGGSSVYYSVDQASVRKIVLADPGEPPKEAKEP